MAIQVTAATVKNRFTVEAGWAGWSSTNPPWALQSGQTVFDHMPAGITAYNVTTYTSSTDVATCLAAVEAAISSGGSGYAYFPAGTYTISALGPIGTNAWYGYANSNRKIMGLIGDGADKTFIVEGSGMIPSAARTYTLAPTDLTTPVTLINLQFSNTTSTTPIFISGITFDGQFQGPYGVPNSSGLSLNTSTASPLAHRGLVLNKAIAGSRVQFCRFRGFAFAIKQSPPYELSGLETDTENMIRYGVEVDGRLPTGEVSAGGDMLNYVSATNVSNYWLHDTRRSGFAIHEHTGGDNGQYTIGPNVQIQNISSTSDSFAGSSLGFEAFNIEEVSGTFTAQNARLALDLGHHFALATTHGNPLANDIVFANITSLSSSYNGCVVLRIIKTPNGSGTNPWWDLYNTSGLAALPIDGTYAGNALTPVDASTFNPAVHFPNQYFMVVTS